MRTWKESDLKFLLNKEYFPNCIECDGHFFHKAGCTRGAEADFEVIDRKLDKRLAEFEKKYGDNGCKITCRDCKKPATGEIRIYYHGTLTIIEAWPVCLDHAFHEDEAGRESRYVGF